MTKQYQQLQMRAISTNADWQIPAGLIVLSAIPVIAGIARLSSLAGGAEITTENARFFAAPLPVIVHIVSVTIYCILGAFQFAPGFRRNSPDWHRAAGRLLVFAGLAAGASGLWMTLFYPLNQLRLQGDLLYGFRIIIASAMLVCISLGWAAIMQRKITRHRAWMIRGYAIGQAAGTQALVMLPWFLIFGTPNELTRDLLMIAAWVINMGFAEWVIRTKLRH
jgi:uncharacterized membrane protein